MSSPRVVSLAPSATATVTALGGADALVGVTRHCDPPSDAGSAHAEQDSDAADRPEIRDTADSPEIRDTADRLKIVGGWLNPSLDRVADLDPDVVLTSDGLQADLAAECREQGLDVRHREPAALDEVIEGFSARGTDIGRPDAGERLATESRARLARVAEAVADRPRPTVYCEEWSDPPMAAGNWVPDAVRAAGGRYPFVDAGDRSREVDLDTVAAADPDHVVVHVCGHGDRIDPETVEGRDWAVDAPVHVIDDSLLNQPSPALIEGIERLARLFHPDAYS